MGDRTSEALAATYDAISKHWNVPVSTLHHRAQGRRSREQKAQSQQYLTPLEEKALEKFLKLMSDLGNSVQIKFVPLLAFSITRQHSTMGKAMKSLGKNWAQGFEKHHSALKSKRVRTIDWKCHENNIYDKIMHWFMVIRQVLQDLAILLENIYNMDETGVILCKLGSVKVLAGKDDHTRL